MESIEILGGIKTEPSTVKYLPPSNGELVEITFDDLYSSEDENNFVQEQDNFIQEVYTISDDSDGDNINVKNPVFNYVGYNQSQVTKPEEVILNFTKNADLISKKNGDPEESVDATITDKDNEYLMSICDDVDEDSNDDNDENVDETNMGTDISSGEEDVKKFSPYSSGISTIDSSNSFAKKCKVETVQGSEPHNGKFNSTRDNGSESKIGLHLTEQRTIDSQKNSKLEEPKRKKKCEYCNFESLGKYLKKHVRRVHDSTPSKCDKCNKMFRNKAGVFDHKRKFHSEREFFCAQCSYKTKQKSNLVHHMIKHRNPEMSEKFSCSQCSFKTIYKHSLTQHALIKHNEKRFCCDRCSFLTSRNYALVLHMTSHKDKSDDEEEFKIRCDKCDFKTHRHHTLKMHKLIHMKPEEIDYFYCHHCDFKSKRKDNLKIHIFKLHMKKNG